MGLSQHQRVVLMRLVAQPAPALPSALGTSWRSLRALKAKHLVAWCRIEQTEMSIGIEGAVITDAGRQRLLGLRRYATRPAARP